MRFVLASCAALCLMAPVAFFACSSGDPAATTDQNQTADASTTEEEESKTDEESTPTDDSDAGVIDTDATVPTENTTDAGVLCTDDAVRESESNNDIGSATVLPSSTSTVCGRVLKDDPDFIKFVMPEEIRGFGFDFEEIRGNLGVQLFINGEETGFNNNIPFEPGGEYVLKLSTKSSKSPADYRIRIDIEE